MTLPSRLKWCKFNIKHSKAQINRAERVIFRLSIPWEQKVVLLLLLFHCPDGRHSGVGLGQKRDLFPSNQCPISIFVHLVHTIDRQTETAEETIDRERREIRRFVSPWNQNVPSFGDVYQELEPGLFLDFFSIEFLRFVASCKSGPILEEALWKLWRPWRDTFA